MIIIQKLLFIAFPVGLAILNLLPAVCSSQEWGETGNIHQSKTKLQEMNSELYFEIKLHGFLLWASVGFLTPVGMLVMRMSNREESARRLRMIYYIHASIQILSVFLATAGAVMSIKYFDNSFNNDHQRIGLALFSVIWIQALIGMLRPHIGSKGRSLWFIFHWLFGIVVCLLGVINIYTGLEAYYQRTSRSVRIWTILFTAQVCLLIFLYLLQEKWNYIQKQGMIIGNEPVQPTDQVIPPRSKDREPSSEPC